MAETTLVAAPVRLRMNIAHGSAGALVAAGTAVASHDSVTAAYIVAGGGVAGLIISQLTAELIRRLRHRNSPDLLAELLARDAEIEQLRGENDRLRKNHHG